MSSQGPRRYSGIREATSGRSGACTRGRSQLEHQSKLILPIDGDAARGINLPDVAVYHDRAACHQLLRPVLAKNAENTCSSARDLHFGQAGRRLPCSLIDCSSLNRFRHLVQRYS